MTSHWQGYATQQSPHHAGCCHSFAFEEEAPTVSAAGQGWGAWIWGSVGIDVFYIFMVVLRAWCSTGYD
jgi:hypothetical protein